MSDSCRPEVNGNDFEHEIRHKIFWDFGVRSSDTDMDRVMASDKYMGSDTHMSKNHAHDVGDVTYHKHILFPTSVANLDATRINYFKLFWHA